MHLLHLQSPYVYWLPLEKWHLDPSLAEESASLCPQSNCQVAQLLQNFDRNSPRLVSIFYFPGLDFARGLPIVPLLGHTIVVVGIVGIPSVATEGRHPMVIHDTVRLGFAKVVVMREALSYTFELEASPSTAYCQLGSKEVDQTSGVLCLIANFKLPSPQDHRALTKVSLH